jgi:hypothetical protein
MSDDGSTAKARDDAAKAMTMIKRRTILIMLKEQNLIAPDQFSRRVLHCLRRRRQKSIATATLRAPYLIIGAHVTL